MVMNPFLRQNENDLGDYATVRGCMCRGVCMCVCRCVGACRQKKYGISWWNVEKKVVKSGRDQSPVTCCMYEVTTTYWTYLQ